MVSEPALLLLLILLQLLLLEQLLPMQLQNVMMPATNSSKDKLDACAKQMLNLSST